MEVQIAKITKANLAKRILAFLMDAAVFLFTFFSLMLFAFVPLSNKAFKYEEKQASQYEMEVFSKLYVYEEKIDDKFIIINNQEELKNVNPNHKTGTTRLDEYTFENLDFIKESLRYYYCNYKTNENLDFIKGSPDIVVEMDLDGAKVSNSTWFEAKIASIDNEEKMRKAVDNALIDFLGSNTYQKLSLDIYKIQMFFICVPFVIVFAGYFIAIPLAFKDGETLGKKVVGISVISADEFKAKKRQIIMRQTMLLSVFMLILLIGGNQWTWITFFGIAIFVNYLVALISKQKRSPIDFAAYTLVVDTKKSVWFDSPEMQKFKEEKVKKNLKNYKKNKVENKNIIQVGSKIVNKEFEKEIEESKK